MNAIKYTIKKLRCFFRSRFWKWVVAHDRFYWCGGVVRSGEISGMSGVHLVLDMRINTSLWLEGRFNDLARRYFDYLKSNWL